MSAAYGSYAELIDTAEVDAIYVATPHSDHTEWVIRALHRDIAVLCEKPMAMQHAETMLMANTAQTRGVFLMEAFMYRVHPQMQQVLQLINAGAIGEVRHVDAQFGYHAPFDATRRHFAADLAGGGILDVGCYPLSFANAVYGSPANHLSAQAHIGSSGVDEWSAALGRYANGCSAQLTTAVSLQLTNQATIYGSSGNIHLTNPWQPDSEWSFTLTDHKKTNKSQHIQGSCDPLYVLEADHVADCLNQGLTQSPLFSLQESLDLALGLDQWRAAAGVQYPAEQPAAYRSVSWGIATKSGPAAPTDDITKSTLAGLDKPVSRLVMGCDNQPSMAHAATMWDDYFLQGGNCFDTAHIYGQGSMETLLGHWHSQRNVREQMVLIGKGAHTPDNRPECIKPQLLESLDRLQTDYIDLYFLHRDNLDIPAGEFIDALNQQVSAGRIRLFGGSNWSLARIRQGNQAAAGNGQQGFAAISNNFSLATMVNPLWPGVEVVQEEDLAYLVESQLAVFPWSSQARGFFTPWTDQVLASMASEAATVTSMQPTVEELKQTWFSEQNLARRQRAGELAERYQVPMITIALAYVLNQAFPTFALIGPRLLQETHSSIGALDVNLSAADIQYLRYGDG